MNEHFKTRMKSWILLLHLVVAAATPFPLRAVPLVTYSFNGSTGSETSFPADAQPTGASASFMTRGSGLTASGAAGAFSSSGWTTGVSTDPNDYYAFALTPNAGFSMTLTQLMLDEKRSLTGIRNWVVRSSLDSFSSDLATFSVPDDDLTRTGQTINLSASFASLTSVTEFRIYGFGAEGAAGTWRVDNVKVEGSTKLLSSVPETGSTALLAVVSFLGLFAFRRFAAGLAQQKFN